MNLSFPKIVMILAALAIIGAGGWYAWSVLSSSTASSPPVEAPQATSANSPGLVRYTTQNGKHARIGYTPCDYGGLVGCFGSGAIGAGSKGPIQLYDLVSTDNAMRVGIAVTTGQGFTAGLDSKFYVASITFDEAVTDTESVALYGEIKSALLNDLLCLITPHAPWPLFTEAEAIVELKKYPEVAAWLKRFTGPNGTNPTTGGHLVITLDSQTKDQYAFLVDEYSADDLSISGTLGWYTVDKVTGEVYYEPIQE